MTGMHTVEQLMRLQEDLEKHGMTMGRPKYGSGDFIAVYPKHDHLPIYTRDAELITGSMEEIDVWLRGWDKAVQYLKFLGAVTDKKIARKEQDYLNQKLLNSIRNSESKETFC